MFCLVQQCLQSRLREAPRARIERLFLSPYDGFGVGVHVKVFAQLGPREGIQLFDACDGDRIEFVLGAVLVKGSVDLAGTKNDAIDLFRRRDG